MEETKHKIKIKRHSRRNWHAAAACLLSIALLVCLSAQYLSFVSKTIYAESTAHLEEVLHKSNNMLSMIVKKNISYLHVWNGFLSSDPDDASTQAYLESAQQAAWLCRILLSFLRRQLHDPQRGNGLLRLADQPRRAAFRPEGRCVEHGPARAGPDAGVHLPRNQGHLPRLCLRCHCHQPLQRCCDEGRGRFGFRRSGQLLCHLPGRAGRDRKYRRRLGIHL